jgi:hypothetical protein
MHAYASDDPVFVAMNKRGQRETGGALGTFCVQCHAPMAVELGLTTGADFDPAQLPATARGVTCYFCHNVKAVQDTHNNGLVLAGDQTMRGGLSGPASSPAHFFWDIARIDSQLLRPPVTLDKNSPLFDHSSTAMFHVEAIAGSIDHITARIRIRPPTYALLADLASSGDLAAGAVTRLPALDILGTQRTWSANPASHAPGTNCSLH